MPTQEYRTKDGKRVPGVTTILGRFKDSGGLIWWANRLALEPALQARALLEQLANGEELGLNVHEFLKIDPKLWDHRAATQKAADAGSICHAMVDCRIRGRVFETNNYNAHLVNLAIPAFNAFEQWAQQSRLEVIETEVALVSEQYRFGGTRDAIMVSGKRAIGDWKTANAVYVENVLQLSAYALLDEEAGNRIDGGYHLLRFSKQAEPNDPIHFVHHFWSDLPVARRAFLLLREAYDLMAELGKLTK